MRWALIFMLALMTSVFSIDVGIDVVVGAGAEGIYAKVWKVLEDLAPDYIILHSGTSSEYDLNFEVIFVVADDGSYVVSWLEDGKEIDKIVRPPDSPFPLRFFLVDAASVPLERAALLKLKKGDWGRYLRLTYRSSIEEYPSFSPDGRYIVFSSDRYGGSRNVFLIDSKEGKMQMLNISGSSEYFPSISPEGSLLLFQGSFTGNWAIYTMPLGGDTRKIRRIAGGWKKAAYMPTWVGEREVAYLMDEEAGNSLWIGDIYSKEATRIDLPFDYVFSPRFCGGKLFFVGLEGADFGIYELTEDGSVLTVEDSEYNEHDLDVSKDCRKILFVSSRDGVYRLWMKNLRSGEVRKITDFIDYDVFYPAFSPDGEVAAIAVYEPDMEPDIWLVRLGVSEKAPGVREEGGSSEEGGEGPPGGFGGS